MPSFRTQLIDRGEWSYRQQDCKQAASKLRHHIDIFNFSWLDQIYINIYRNL